MRSLLRWQTANRKIEGSRRLSSCHPPGLWLNCIAMLRLILLFFLGIPLSIASQYGTLAVPISASHDYFQKTVEPDYWALSPYYVGQSGAGASSVASMIMILNFAKMNLPIALPTAKSSPLGLLTSAIPSPLSGLSDQEMITQDVLLRKTGEGEWTRNAANPGSSMTLDQLSHVIEQACKAFGFTHAQATAYHAHKTDEFRKTLHDALTENKKSHDDFILADFNESAYVGEVDIDHVAPVGAYDVATNRVLIMDPDRQWYEPYWVSEATFLEGISTADKITGMTRGFIWLKLR
jgi:hypothetical protein